MGVLRVGDIMERDFPKIEQSDSLRKAVKKMVDMESDFLVAFSPQGAIGFLSAHDVITKSYDSLEGKNVADVMSKGIISVDGDTSIAKAVNLMMEKHIHHLIVTEGGNVVGVLYDLDLLKLVGKKILFRAKEARRSYLGQRRPGRFR
jgi:predicted transcriptional regulator